MKCVHPKLLLDDLWLIWVAQTPLVPAGLLIWLQERLQKGLKKPFCLNLITSAKID
jgi:hypothetical protein